MRFSGPSGKYLRIFWGFPGWRLAVVFLDVPELAALTGVDDFDAGVEQLSPKVPVLVVTRSAQGAVAVANGERAEALRLSPSEGSRFIRCRQHDGRLCGVIIDKVRGRIGPEGGEE